MEDEVISTGPLTSLEKIPAQCTEKSSSPFGLMPYRICSYSEWHSLQCSEMSYSRENLNLSYSIQQSVPYTEKLPPSKGVFISFSGGSVYSDRFPVQCTEMSLPTWSFPSLCEQSPYLNKFKKISSPKFDDLLSLHKRPSYLDNLPVQCTETPSPKEASTSFGDRSSQLVSPPAQCTEISSLKDDFSSLSTRPSHLDKLPIQCAEISSPKDDFLSLSGRTTHCDKFPTQCTEIPSPADDLPSLSRLLPSYLENFPIQCTEMSLPTDD